jgi:hypothetical protein
MSEVLAVTYKDLLKLPAKRLFVWISCVRIGGLGRERTGPML